MNILDRQKFYAWQRFDSSRFSTEKLAEEKNALNTGKITSMVKDEKVFYIADYWNHQDHYHIELAFNFSGTIVKGACNCVKKGNIPLCEHVMAFYEYLLGCNGLVYTAGRPARTFLKMGTIPEGLPEGFPVFPAVILKSQSNSLDESPLAKLAEYYRLWTPPLKLEQPVNLLPIITINKKKTLLSFKIGSDKTYIIKSLSTLLLNVKNERVVFYGKKLNFSHRLDNFNSVSQKLIAFLSALHLPLSENDRYLELTPEMKRILFTILEDNVLALSIDKDEVLYRVTQQDIHKNELKEQDIIIKSYDKEYVFDKSTHCVFNLKKDVSKSLYDLKLVLDTSKDYYSFKFLMSTKGSAYQAIDTALWLSYYEHKMVNVDGLWQVSYQPLKYFTEQSALLLAIMECLPVKTRNSYHNLILDSQTFNLMIKLCDQMSIILDQEPMAYKLASTPLSVGIKAEDNYLSLDLKDEQSIKKYHHTYYLVDQETHTINPIQINQIKLIPTFEVCVNEPILIKGHEDVFRDHYYPYVNKLINLSPEYRALINDYAISIVTYLSYDDGNIVLEYKICDGQNKELSQIPEAYNDLLQDYLNLMVSYGFKLAEPHIINTLAMQVQFLRADLTPLKEMGPVYLDEHLSRMKVEKIKPTSTRVSFNVNVLSIAFENLDYTNEELYKLLTAYKQKKQFFKLSKDTIIDMTTPEFMAFAEKVEDLGLDEHHLTEEQQIPLWQVFNLNNQQEVDGKLKDLLNDIAHYKEKNCHLVDPFKNVMRAYQVEAFNWLTILTKYGFGGILADDMGLGKSLEMISLLALDKVNKPSLIACPSSLVYNWAQEIAKWMPSLNYKLINGPKTLRKSYLDQINPKKKCIYITSYDTLREDIDLYHTMFRFVVLDEAQFIKNEAAQKSRAVKRLNGEVHFALTGTPIENTLSDLWSIFDFIMPKYLGTYARFRERYAGIMDNDDSSLKALTRKISPFILRRTKKDVLKDLPEKIESVSYVSMDDEQKACYESYLLKTREAMTHSRATDFTVLSLLMRLRQICVDPHLFIDNYTGEAAKLQHTVELCQSSVESGHRILIFSQFKSIFIELAQRLNDVGITTSVLTGDVKSKERMELVENFNQPDGAKVFLISLKAGGTGLNLTAADIVIHLDPWWNEAAENQASDRAHRIGQDRVVQVIKLICKDSIEEKVLKLQEVKSGLATKVIGENDQRISALTENDLKYILS